MSVAAGAIHKGEKSKKFQSLNINNIYQGSVTKNVSKRIPQKHGLQSLGKVPTARRAPANLPSLKSEICNSDVGKCVTPVTQNSVANSTGLGGASGWASLSEEKKNIVKQHYNDHNQEVVGSALNNNNKPVDSSLVTISNAPKTWRRPALTTLKQAGGFLNKHSPLFVEEFPSLSDNDASLHKMVPSDNTEVAVSVSSLAGKSYGPGPCLRPQAFGNWLLGGVKPPLTERMDINVSDVATHPPSIDAGPRPIRLDHLDRRRRDVPIPSQPQFDVSLKPPPPSQQGSTLSKKNSSHSTALSNVDDTAGGNNGIGMTERISPRFNAAHLAPPVSSHRKSTFIAPSIINTEKFRSMDDFDINDDDWTRNDESFDYNKKLVSDNDDSDYGESVSSNWADKFGGHHQQLPKKAATQMNNHSSSVQDQVLSRPVPRVDELITYNITTDEDEETQLIRSTRKNQEILKNVERSKKRREEEELKYNRNYRNYDTTPLSRSVLDESSYKTFDRSQNYPLYVLEDEKEACFEDSSSVHHRRSDPPRFASKTNTESDSQSSLSKKLSSRELDLDSSTVHTLPLSVNMTKYESSNLFNRVEPSVAQPLTCSKDDGISGTSSDSHIQSSTTNTFETETDWINPSNYQPVEHVPVSKSFQKQKPQLLSSTVTDNRCISSDHHPAFKNGNYNESNQLPFEDKYAKHHPDVNLNGDRSTIKNCSMEGTYDLPEYLPPPLPSNQGETEKYAHDCAAVSYGASTDQNFLESKKEHHNNTKLVSGWFAPRGQPSRRGRGVPAGRCINNGQKIVGINSWEETYLDYERDNTAVNVNQADILEEYTANNLEECSKSSRHMLFIPNDGSNSVEQFDDSPIDKTKNVSKAASSLKASIPVFERRGSGMKLPPRFAKQQSNYAKSSSSGFDMRWSSNSSVAGGGVSDESLTCRRNLMDNRVSSSSSNNNNQRGEGNSTQKMFLHGDNLMLNLASGIAQMSMSNSSVEGNSCNAANESSSSTPVHTIIFENTNLKGVSSSSLMETSNETTKIMPSLYGQVKDAYNVGSGTTDIRLFTKDIVDSSDLKLDFVFDSATGDQARAATLGRSTVSQSMPPREDLNMKIASVKKVWETLPMSNVSTFSSSVCASPAMTANSDQKRYNAKTSGTDITSNTIDVGGSSNSVKMKSHLAPPTYNPQNHHLSKGSNTALLPEYSQQMPMVTDSALYRAFQMESRPSNNSMYPNYTGSMASAAHLYQFRTATNSNQFNSPPPLHANNGNQQRLGSSLRISTVPPPLPPNAAIMGPIGSKSSNDSSSYTGIKSSLHFDSNGNPVNYLTGRQTSYYPSMSVATHPSVPPPNFVLPDYSSSSTKLTENMTAALRMPFMKGTPPDQPPPNLSESHVKEPFDGVNPSNTERNTPSGSVSINQNHHRIPHVHSAFNQTTYNPTPIQRPPILMPGSKFSTESCGSGVLNEDVGGVVEEG